MFISGYVYAASSSIPIINDDSLNAMSTTIGGGVDVLPTTRTIPHWWGSTVNPVDGITYGYNMVGADPNNCVGDDCSVVIFVDITPINVNVGGITFSADDIVDATIQSPQFSVNDYATTPYVTTADNLSRGPGGQLSQGSAGQLLQLQDATMRIQFNQTSANSNYHVVLQPILLPTVTIKGSLLQSGRGVVFASVNVDWWAAKIQQLETSADPTHLPLYLTNNVMLHIGVDPYNCCIIGFHGTQAVGAGGGATNSQGNAPVQTFAWASWIQPGLYAQSQLTGGRNWALQDIHALSHEIAECADDPFVNNTVQPWLTPTAPQYGCTNYLETGDPVVGIGFAIGTNNSQQGPAPDGSQVAMDTIIRKMRHYSPGLCEAL